MKRLRKLVTVFLVTIGGFWIFLYASAVYYRNRSERLIAAIEKMPPNMTYEQVRQMAERFGGGPEGPCTEQSCDYFVQVMSPLLHSLATRFALGRLGLRPWMVRARFGFHDGRSNGGLSMWVGAPRGALIDVDNDHPVWYWLDASTSFSPSGLEEEKALHRADRDPSVASHSDFLIYKPCLTTYGGGEVLNTLLSNDPARATREMAFDRNLSCLTAFESCTELCELAPRAWAQFVADGAHGCNMGEEALTRARRACGDWAGQVGKPSN